VEDLHAVAEAICERVDKEPDLKSVGVLHAPDGLLREVQQLNPDVVLLDLYYGGRDAFPQLRVVAQAAPQVRIIVVSGDNHPETIRRAFEAGARGYVVKGDPAEIVAAIRAVWAGGSWRPGDSPGRRPGDREVDAIIDAMIAALGDPVAVEGQAWRWQAGRLRIEAREEQSGVVIDLPWPLRSVTEAPSFGDLHEESDGEVKLRFLVATRAALDLVLGVIGYESREG